MSCVTFRKVVGPRPTTTYGYCLDQPGPISHGLVTLVVLPVGRFVLVHSNADRHDVGYGYPELLISFSFVL